MRQGWEGPGDARLALTTPGRPETTAAQMSLRRHLPTDQEEEVTRVLERLRDDIQQIWGVALPPLCLAADRPADDAAAKDTHAAPVQPETAATPAPTDAACSGGAKAASAQAARAEVERPVAAPDAETKDVAGT